MSLNLVLNKKKSIFNRLGQDGQTFFRDGPLENLWGRGEEVQKKIFAQGFREIQ